MKMRYFLAALVVLGSNLQFHAQSPTKPLLAYEVASVKPSGGGDFSSSSFVRSPGSLYVSNMRLRDVISRAFEFGAARDRPDLTNFKLVGGPNSILSARFDISAKSPSGVDESRHTAMLRTLLAERFKLRMHTEVRQIPIYALTVVRRELGPRLRRSTLDCERVIEAARSAPKVERDATARCAGGFGAPEPWIRGLIYSGPIELLVRGAQTFLDRPLVDFTGLNGNFEWATTFATKPDVDELTIFGAFERDLGLKIDRRTGPYEVFVIDSVELPTPD